MIDSDEATYSALLLHEWKAIRELSAALELRGFEVVKARGFAQLERKIPTLIQEIRDDLSVNPFIREFYCKSKNTTIQVMGEINVLRCSYAFEDHPYLLTQMQIMENYGAIAESNAPDAQQSNVVRTYRLEEEFVDYLLPPFSAENGK